LNRYYKRNTTLSKLQKIADLTICTFFVLTLLQSALVQLEAHP
jgi:hypothetical protein